MNQELIAQKLLSSRRALVDIPASMGRLPEGAEGGCGVLGLASNVPIAGRNVVQAAAQMHNRGNGKGGGIAMAGLCPAQMGVSPGVLHEAYLMQIAYLDPNARREVEASGLPALEILEGYRVPTLDDWRGLPDLDVQPPEVWRYFARVKADSLARFADENGLEEAPARAVEDEFVYQNSFRLNRRFYASLGEQRAFVLCHGRDLIVLKIVGYAEQVVQYYRLEDAMASVWIAHQRYPTKGRVWHPGGAHPFIGLNEALVHNGDFANYHAVREYLSQRNIAPLFLTDTEVSVQLFDLWDRIYGYPLEVTLEALAPTTERDFVVLPAEKQALYRAVQATHLHASPDGPWFFIIARSRPDVGEWQLLGITDTSMLRPQVFALYENHGVELGVIASERQAINAVLRSLSAEDQRFMPVADRYWVARGGSHTDGGAFAFTVRRDGTGRGLGEPGRAVDRPVADQATEPTGDRISGLGLRLECRNKFGELVELAADQHHVDRTRLGSRFMSEGFQEAVRSRVYHAFDNGGPDPLYRWASERAGDWTYDETGSFTNFLVGFAAEGADEWDYSCHSLTMLRDRQYDPGNKRRASVLSLIDASLTELFDAAPSHQATGRNAHHVSRISWDISHTLRPPQGDETTLLLDCEGFPPEGDHSAARLLVAAYGKGWQRIIAYNWRGGRFAGCGLGPGTQGVRIDLYGDVGDYAASGLDGADVRIHADAQDQVGQILKDGKLVIHGDVGQTFLYGAKGGTVYVMGSAAGRPLINAVGRPRVVINGTCLDYLAESFMAGDPLTGGGFAIVNGVAFNEHGRLIEMDTPYPGGNLFSLASGGAVYLRDPHRRVGEDQLNGGRFAPLSEADWMLIRPYLVENEELFAIELTRLLTVDREQRSPADVYRKIEAQSLAVLR